MSRPGKKSWDSLVPLKDDSKFPKIDRDWLNISESNMLARIQTMANSFPRGAARLFPDLEVDREVNEDVHQLKMSFENEYENSPVIFANLYNPDVGYNSEISIAIQEVIEDAVRKAQIAGQEIRFRLPRYRKKRFSITPLDRTSYLWLVDNVDILDHRWKNMKFAIRNYKDLGLTTTRTSATMFFPCNHKLDTGDLLAHLIAVIKGIIPEGWTVAFNSRKQQPRAGQLFRVLMTEEDRKIFHIHGDVFHFGVHEVTVKFH